LNKQGLFAVALGISVSVVSHAATGPSVENFAARPRVEDASISPDGRYIAQIETQDGRGLAVVTERESSPQSVPHVVMSEPDHFRITWCRWATNTRLLCGLRAMVKGSYVYSVTRLVGVDADGKNIQVLIQDSEGAQGQFQDRIVNWNPGPADTVLVEADEGKSPSESAPDVYIYGNVGTHALPGVFELNVVTGRLVLREHARNPIRHWITDARGQVRLGWGFAGTTISYYARLDGDRDWRRLTRFEVFSRENHFDPIAISAEDSNKAYAFGTYEGRKALWLIDLTDKEDPTLVFAHPAVDVGSPVLAVDGRLLGVSYQTGYPMMYFADEHTAAMIGSIQKLLPGKFSVIHGSSRDGKVYVIRSFSDVDAPSFLILDTSTHTATTLSAAYPGRDVTALAPMRSISYAARDGTPIPGYLSTPPGVPATHLPLIVMPHGGPIARDTWSYFFLREFLVSRGYAVLQMNFRGSSGYGQDWFFAAHQDWGGLTYDDVVDGARWAIKQGIADPERVCIVGWSFGGYLALVGAQRNADLFRCSVDIAGVSDLGLLIDEGYHWLNSGVIKQQIGTDSDKLKRDSPRLHAADFNVPLLILHGTMDAQVPFAQSDAMDTALKHAAKPHRFVVFPDADHQFSAEKDRVTLLQEIAAFLNDHLAVAAPQVP
jgi:dipeptidyl aminopeptidase/acylaminoacyl peptidase